MHIHGCQKIWVIHIPNSENSDIYIRSFKKVVYHILDGAEKGSIRHAHPYYVIYRELPPPPLPEVLVQPRKTGNIHGMTENR